MRRKLKITAILVCATLLALMFGRSTIERKLLFFPSHHGQANGLTPWIVNGQTIGFAHVVASPKNVWLMAHGNAGQAADRDYALPSFSPEDSVYILEYPGYGRRPGTPSKDSFNNAANEAYQHLRQTFTNIPVCTVGESIGAGPICFLATLQQPPEKIVLIVPFADLASTARDHFPNLIVKLLLKQNWDNIATLSNYKGPIQIFAAKHDNIIQPKHAQALANSKPNAVLKLLDCGHNDWSNDPTVQIRNP